MNNIVIVGGGIAGLVSALLLSKNRKNKITLLEKDDSVGGLLKKFDYKEYGFFDYGAHNLLETGIKELDKELLSLLPKEEWEVLDGYKREISGVYFNNRLQKNSSLIDLRGLDNYKYLVEDFVKSLDTKECDENDLYSYFLNKYGDKITNEVLKEIVEDLYQDDISNLDALAAVMTPLSRVILFNQQFMDELNKSDILRSKLGYPEQKELSFELSSKRRAFYPKKYGMYRIIDALVKKLKSNNVNILLNTSISKMDVVDNQIISIKLNDGSKIDEIDEMVWTVGLPFLSSLLKLKSIAKPDEKRVKTVIVNLLTKDRLNVDDLYYMYGYGKNLGMFRLSTPYNYCTNAVRYNAYPSSIEILLYNDCELKNIENITIEKLKKMKILAHDNKIIFSKAEVLNGGFIHPSQKNRLYYDELRNSIFNQKIESLTTIGILSENNLFFQTDILIDLYNKIRLIND